MPTALSRGSVTFHIINSTPWKIQVEFYSQILKRAWPGNGMAWDVERDDQSHDFSLTCDSGEKICFGAWSTPHHFSMWGVGDKGASSCKGCCYVCGYTTRPYNLVYNSPDSGSSFAPDQPSSGASEQPVAPPNAPGSQSSSGGTTSQQSHGLTQSYPRPNISSSIAAPLMFNQTNARGCQYDLHGRFRVVSNRSFQPRKWYAVDPVSGCPQ